MKQVKLVIALVFFTIGSIYSQSSYNQKSNLCDTCNLSGPRWGNAVTLPGQYHAGTDTNFVIFYRDTFGGGIGYGIAVDGDTSLYFLDYDSTAMDWVVKWRSTTFFDINKQLQVGALGNSTFGVRLPNITNASSLATDANGKIIPGTSGSGGSVVNYHLTYAQASDSVTNGDVVPYAWYHITDKAVYIQGLTDSTFSLEGYYADSTIWEIDAIEFDFANEHIQQRCDKRGNCVGAAFDYVDMGLLTVDPISVFAWGDGAVQGNTVKNGVFDLTGITGSYFIRDNVINSLSEIELSNVGAISFTDNIIEGGVIWDATNVEGNFIANRFYNEIEVSTSGFEGSIIQNTMGGIGYWFRFNNTTGANILQNTGEGHIQCNESSNFLMASNYLRNGAYIYADSMSADINANSLYRGAELYMTYSDSAFSKNYLDFTAIVHAENNQNRSEYNRILGCGNGLGTVFIVTVNTSGFFSNNTIKSCGDSVVLNPAVSYNNNFIDFTGNIGIGTLLPTEAVEIIGSIKIVDGTQSNGYVLTSDANGKGIWQDHTAYGEMGFGDSLRTIALTQNVFSVVTNSNNTLWSTAAIDLHSVTYSGDSLIIDSAGVYQINAQLSVEGTNASIIRMGVFINGVLACTCTGWQQLSNNQIVQLTYINIETLNVGDVLQVVIANTANNDDVDAIGGKVMVNKIR